MKAWWGLVLVTLMGACDAQPPQPPSILVIDFDTLRADHSGPNLKKFAAESVRFTQAYASANETLFSVASLFTSRYPSELGAVSRDFRLPASTPSLPGLLRLAGYSTAAVTGGGHMGPAFGMDQGFDHFDVPAEWGSTHHVFPPAIEFLQARRQGAPLFLWLHADDAHARYLKPPPLGTMTLPKDLDAATYALLIAPYGNQQIQGGDGDEQTQRQIAAMAAAYEGAVAYLDTWLGLFMADLDGLGLLDSTWIVVLSSHGEMLGENGRFDHRHDLTDEVLHVPLMIRPPGGLDTGLKVDALTSLLDLQPTFLELAGLNPPQGIHGRSLLPAIQGQPQAGHPWVFSEGAITGISARSASERRSFMDLNPSDAGLEARLDAHPVLRAWRQSLTLPASETRATPDAPLKEALRERGYWDAP